MYHIYMISRLDAQYSVICNNLEVEWCLENFNLQDKFMTKHDFNVFMRRKLYFK